MGIVGAMIAIIAGIIGLMVGYDYLSVAQIGRGVAEFGRRLGDNSMSGEMNQIYAAVWFVLIASGLAITGGGLAMAKKEKPSMSTIAVAAVLCFLSFGLGWRRGSYTIMFGIAYIIAASCVYAETRSRTGESGLTFDNGSSAAGMNPSSIGQTGVPSSQPQSKAAPKTYEPILGVETEALIKRANLFLEDGNFSEADRYLEQALNQDPENPRVYLGKLMVEKNAHTPDDLISLATPLDEEKLFQRALRFADGETKSRLESYAQDNRAKIDQREAEKAAHREEQYLQAVARKEQAMISCELQQLRDSQSSLLSLVPYKDAEALAQELQTAISREEKYLNAVKLKGQAISSEDFKFVICQFEELGDYKNSPLLLEEAKTAMKEAEAREVRQSKIMKRCLFAAAVVIVAIIAGNYAINAYHESKLTLTQRLNSTYSGKYLGNSFTSAQSEAIRTGTFDGMALGDYWTIDGVNWRIADFDYLIRTNNVDASKHHVMIVPDKSLYQARMNSTDTTSGGYAVSEMRNSGLDQAKDMIGKAFGAEHILADYGVELMTGEMVFGEEKTWLGVFGNGDNALSLFRLKTDFRKADEDVWMYWLQDVASSASFCDVYDDGDCINDGASGAGGVRPAFAIF